MSEKADIKAGDLVKTIAFGTEEDGTPRPQPIWHEIGPGNTCFAFVPFGSICMVIDEQYGMYQIQSSDYFGWVYKDYVELY